MRIETSGDTYTYSFDSLADLTESVNRAIEKPRTDGSEGERAMFMRSRKTGAPLQSAHTGYDSLKTWQDAEKRLAEGWPDGASKIAELVDSIQENIPPAKSIRRRMVWGDQGDEIEITKVYSGELDSAWREARRCQSAGTPTITIQICWGNASVITPDSMFWQAAAGIACADVLEKAGYRVELRAGRHVGHPDSTQDFSVLLKDPSQPVDISSVAALCCSAGIYRTFGFGVMLCHARAVSGGMGTHHDRSDTWDGEAYRFGYGVRQTSKEAAIQSATTCLKAITGVTNAD